MDPIDVLAEFPRNASPRRQWHELINAVDADGIGFDLKYFALNELLSRFPVRIDRSDQLVCFNPEPALHLAAAQALGIPQTLLVTHELTDKQKQAVFITSRRTQTRVLQACSYDQSGLEELPDFLAGERISLMLATDAITESQALSLTEVMRNLLTTIDKQFQVLLACTDPAKRDYLAYYLTRSMPYQVNAETIHLETNGGWLLKDGRRSYKHWTLMRNY